MEQEPSPSKETAPYDAGPARDRLKDLIDALMDLKSGIESVENKHPALGNELSSLCSLVIKHLEHAEDHESAAGRAEPQTPVERQQELSSIPTPGTLAADPAVQPSLSFRLRLGPEPPAVEERREP